MGRVTNHQTGHAKFLWLVYTQGNGAALLVQKFPTHSISLRIITAMNF
ncbi:MAG: hypothetical protein OJF59_001980 [Cytophagales bacterium]|nr:MAG: hypothetical protein OJF59_001980 [Cytophagales bacterium]